MTFPKPDPPRGILNQQEGLKHFLLSRYVPSKEISCFVEHYWIVRWDLRGKNPFRQEVLSHPSVHLVFEKNGARIVGVVPGKFTTVLEGNGKVFGVKFRPGTFYPFIRKPVASFTNEYLPFREVFAEPPEHLAEEILHHENDESMVDRAEAFLIRNLPQRDPRAEEVCRIVESIMNDPSILKVDQLVEQFGRSKRSLQRFFRQYVGVSPKWVIQRYRLHEAAEKMAGGQADNWPALALDLGYFDQAHFIRDFKAIVGSTPSEYARQLRGDDKGKG